MPENHVFLSHFHTDVAIIDALARHLEIESADETKYQEAFERLPKGHGWERVK